MTAITHTNTEAADRLELAPTDAPKLRAREDNLHRVRSSQPAIVAQPSTGTSLHDPLPERVVDLTGETLRPVLARPLMAWTSRNEDRQEQFTHAVLDGSYLSACGAMMTMIGDPWPEPPAPTPQPRCEICSQAVNRTWAGLDHITSTAEMPR